MKTTLKLFVLLIVILNLQCSKSNDDDTITRDILNQKKSNIHDYISSFECTGSANCQSMALGSKPCGGPWEYIVFPSSVNLETLTQMVNEYNQMEHEFNMKTGAMSDCAIVNPPSQIECVNGECTIIN